MTKLDDDSYEPLASMAREVSRELGGDGLLMTWHEDVGEPRHLFVEGLCETQPETARAVAERAKSTARLQDGGMKSHWATLADDPTSCVLTTSIAAERGVVTIATVFKRIGRSTRLRAGEAVARLLPLLQPFFRSWLSQLRAVSTVRALTAVIDDSHIGVMLLDRTGQITFCNSIADQLLSLGDGLRRRGSMVAAGSMTDTLRLHAAIDHALASDTFRPSRPGHQIVALRRKVGRPLMAAVVSNTDVEHGAADCAAIIYIVDPEQDLQRLIEPVCDFYALSPAETRLACTLVGGRSLAEAAEHLHVREQTARSYLKQIFLKTETNRQAELVRLLLLSAVRTGHVTSRIADRPQTGVIV